MKKLLTVVLILTVIMLIKKSAYGEISHFSDINKKFAKSSQELKNSNKNFLGKSVAGKNSANTDFDLKTKAKELNISEERLNGILNSIDSDKQPQDSIQADGLQQTQSINGTTASINFAKKIADAGDVNGDGYADLMVSADAYSTNRGRVYIYYGGLNIDHLPDVILTGEAVSNYFGSSLSSAGDVNGDGYDDVIVGASGYNSNTGRAYIYYGGSPMNSNADVLMTGESTVNYFGCSVSKAGDVNGDGYYDVIVGAYGYSAAMGRAYVYYGGSSMNNAADVTMTGEIAGSNFGTSVSSAGNVNGDGYSDVIVGANNYNSLTGRVYIFLGSSSMDNSADVFLNGEFGLGSSYGYSVALAGDVNGDGYSDVIVSTPFYGSNSGKAYLYLGSSSMNNVADATFTGDGSASFFGLSVSSAGDINEDGYSDIIIGAYAYNSSTGRAFVFFGGTAMDNAVDIMVTGEGTNNYFGYSVTSTNDMNGDGKREFIVGAYGSNSNLGKIYFYQNSFSGFDIPDETFLGPSAGSFFGYSLSNAGDVNGDGYQDIIVGAYAVNSTTGIVYIYYGGNVLNNTADVTLYGAASNSYFGESVSGAGDVNGDGYSDVIVGATNYSTGTGRAYIYFGGSDMDNNADITMTGVDEYNYFGIVSSAGDLNGDGYSDVMVGASGYNSNTGITYIYFGGNSMNNVVDVTLYGFYAGERFGSSVSSGDFNGDGYSDLIVGANGYSSYKGRAYIYFGGRTMDILSDVVLTGEFADDYFGSMVRSAGDVNNDGFSDVIVGAYGHNSFSGKAYLYFGSPLMDNTADVTFTNSIGSFLFGTMVSSAGDINGDGFSDVMVGNPSSGLNSSSKTFIYFGGSIMNTEADIILPGESNSNFGSSGAAADINNDGLSDVIIGAYGYNSSEGKVYLYLSSSPPVKPNMLSVKDVPNDEGGFVHLKWSRSGYDIQGQNMITNYQIERSGPPASGGFAWEIHSTVPANYLPQYLSTVSTWADSNVSGSTRIYYRVTARTSNNNVFWRSNIIYGQSTDNLAPAQPLNLKASQTQTAVNLNWSRSAAVDFSYYKIYRDDIVIGNAANNSYKDSSVSGSSILNKGMDKKLSTRNNDNISSNIYEYSVSAVDIHGNESKLSDSVNVNFAPFTSVDLVFIPEGFYNTLTGMLNSRDTVTAYLREVNLPYNIVDSATGVLDSVTFNVNLEFRYADDGIYYIVIKHRNSLETWSKIGGENYSRGANFSYDFSAVQSQAYGDNLLLKNGKWCVYSGDINSDGLIDAVDRAMCWNFRNISGYLKEDVNGDGIIDAQDRGIIWNNRNKFVLSP